MSDVRAVKEGKRLRGAVENTCCEIEDRPGLVLVEAKANAPELSAFATARDENASSASQANHDRIGMAINEACAYLKGLNPAVAISRDSHYQLSNRIAFAWKLASLGVPTVLVYLGFYGDEGIRDAGEPFRDNAHWNEAFASYAHTLVPSDLFNKRLDCGKAPTWFLVKGRKVLEISPAR